MKNTKIMKSKILQIKTIMSVLSVMVLALFIAACDENTAQKGSATFIGGLDSISMDFEKSSFPSEIYDNKQSPFTISVKLENKGEFPVTRDKIRVSLDGIDAAEIGKTSSDMRKNPADDLSATKLEATTGKIIPGAQTFVEFGEFSYQGKVIGQRERPLIATVCFDYATAGQANLCVKEKPLDTLEKNQVCDVRGAKALSVSSGPVQVTNFQQTPTGTNKIQFTFDVEHKGDGSIYKQSTDCLAKEENKVFISIDTDDMSSSLVCTGIQGGQREGYITLYGGKKPIICTQTIPAGKKGTFEKVVTIKLQYGYEKVKKAQITVKPSEQS